MAFTAIYPKRAPRIGKDDEWISFDAVLEDSIEYSVDYTQFPIEIGATATDHGIIRPATQVMTVTVSDNPLSTRFTDIVTGFVSNFFDSGTVATVAGLSGGFLSGEQDSRSKSVLEFFVALMYSRNPFDVDSVDTTLSNMVITRMRRNRNPQNEGGLILVLEMQELPVLSTTITQNQPSVDEINSNDPAQTQAAADTNKGEVLGVSVSSDTQSVIEGLL